MKLTTRALRRVALLAISFASGSALASVPYHGAFTEASPASIQPQGWVKEILHRQAIGLAAHHQVSGYPFDTCLWAGKIPPNPNPNVKANPKAWWPYEQAGYLVDGLTRLGIITGENAILDEANANVQYILSNPQPDGSLGPSHIGGTNWPHAVVFRALMASYAASPNPAIPEALQKHYLSRADDYGAGRDSANIEIILWTYAHTGDSRLLEIARRTYDNFNRNKPKTGLEALQSDAKIVEHGVTFNETAKLPAILYLYTGDKALLDASVNAYRKLDRDHMLASGMHSAQEYLAGKDPWTLIETCDISDYTWSLGYMLMATGDASFADHIEKAIFNAGMGAIGKDFKSHQYFSATNQVIATHGICKAHHPDRQAYRPGHDVECCTGNVHRMLPNYALRQWMRTPEGGIVAALYGPSRFVGEVNAVQVTIDQQTGYPFSDQIDLVIHAPSAVEFPLALRIPGWTSQAKLEINGQTLDQRCPPGEFVTLKRKFADNDRITLHLPASVRAVEWEKQTLSIERGPLVFALKIEESAEPKFGVKTSEEFPAWDKRPASPWAFAIAPSAASEIKVNLKSTDAFPWETASVPIELQLPARAVTNWKLPESGGNPGFPESLSLADAPETVRLIPFGATSLRLTVFPEDSSR